MEWLNYHHLFYFWRIAREGSLTRAAEELHVTHSTLSAQLRSLEEHLGGALFERRGRILVLTSLGHDIAGYSDDIFRLGNELVEVARGNAGTRRVELRVGVVGAIPKAVAHAILAPGLSTQGYGPLVVRQEKLGRLLEELAAGRLHLVLADGPPPEGAGVRVFGHLLGESRILMFGERELAKTYRPGFPASLAGAPLLLPTGPSALRRLLERWLAEREIRPRIEGEFDDAALMRVFGVHGHGLWPVREALRAELEGISGVEQVGVLDGVVERYWILSGERRVRHPAVTEILARGREGLARTSRRPPQRATKRRRPSDP